MSKQHHQFYATDNDLFDLLASAKQKLTEAVLREVGRERGIFYSPEDSRDDLVESLSVLPFMLPELERLMARRETPRRNEKTTTITLDAQIAIDDIKTAVNEYCEQVGPAEQVSAHKKGTNGLVMSVEYDEIDYSRTRLIQRQRHDAAIEFTQKEGKTVIRLPASDKSRRIVEDVTKKIESRRRAPVAREAIELDDTFTAEERTKFFTRLMSELPDHKINSVTNIRICPSGMNPDEEEFDEEERAAAEHDLLVVVRSMALNGENLFAAKEYQNLRERGFFLTSVTWKAGQIGLPYDIPLLQVEFEDGPKGVGFKYAVKGAYRFQEGFYTKTPRPVTDDEREKLYSLIELTARRVLSDIRDKRAAGKGSESGTP